MRKIIKMIAWIIGVMVIFGVLTGLYIKSEPKNQISREKVFFYIGKEKVLDITGKPLILKDTQNWKYPKKM